MSPYAIQTGDVKEVLSGMEVQFDGCLTDPPYGLSFMGKSWDHGVPSADVWAEVYRVLKPGAFLLAFGGTRTFHRLTCAIEDAGFEIRDCVMWLYGSGFPKSHNWDKDGVFKGYGTALKPAWEPCIVAMKPLDGTFANNALKHGVAGINVEAGRVAHNEECRMMAPSRANIDAPSEKCRQAGRREAVLELKPEGRWPANLILDESFDQEWSRFFYCAKANKKDRAGSKHPTVKPIALMRYLCRLITPPGGTVLDPFAGSGTTGEAAIFEGFNVILIEREQEYIADIKGRIQNLEETNSSEQNDGDEQTSFGR